ncbi:hypothetical protein [Serratia sp. DD3]|uniref:hypothetical protein n=1 Tax=Serratia sp. DD3 TaxID=1410619 RepID=UPI0012680A1E|nr:hypothetical protein [Serratia sp. DD3]
MLIVLFCWADSATGQTSHATKTTGIVASLSATIADEHPGISASEHHVELDRPSSDLRRKPLSQRPQLLLRVHAYANSLLASSWLVPAYTLTAETPEPIGGMRQQWRSVPPIAQRLQQINWMLHSPAQQNRVGGWKESNILYRGSLTYDS